MLSSGCCRSNTCQQKLQTAVVVARPCTGEPSAFESWEGYTMLWASWRSIQDFVWRSWVASTVLPEVWKDNAHSENKAFQQLRNEAAQGCQIWTARRLGLLPSHSVEFWRWYMKSPDKRPVADFTASSCFMTSIRFRMGRQHCVASKLLSCGAPSRQAAQTLHADRNAAELLKPIWSKQPQSQAAPACALCALSF